MVELIARALAGMRRETGAPGDSEWRDYCGEALLILDSLSGCPALPRIGRIAAPRTPGCGLFLHANDR
jgi:hypothetical protein